MIKTDEVYCQTIADECLYFERASNCAEISFIDFLSEIQNQLGVGLELRFRLFNGFEYYFEITWVQVFEISVVISSKGINEWFQQFWGLVGLLEPMFSKIIDNNYKNNKNNNKNEFK